MKGGASGPEGGRQLVLVPDARGGGNLEGASGPVTPGPLAKNATRRPSC